MDVDSVSVRGWPWRIFDQSTIFRNDLASGALRANGYLPNHATLPSVAGFPINPDSRGDSAVGNGVAKSIEENTNGVAVVVWLGQVATGERSHLLPSHAVQSALSERCQVFKGGATSRQGGKVGMGRPRTGRRRHRRQTYTHVLLESAEPASNELGSELC